MLMADIVVVLAFLGLVVSVSVIGGLIGLLVAEYVMARRYWQ